MYAGNIIEVKCVCIKFLVPSVGFARLMNMLLEQNFFMDRGVTDSKFISTCQVMNRIFLCINLNWIQLYVSVSFSVCFNMYSKTFLN